MSMIFSKAGEVLLERFEDIRTIAYLDSAGVWTIGIGTTHYPNGEPVKQGDVCTREQAIEWMVAYLADEQREVNAMLTIPVTQNQYDALICFAYNEGWPRLKTSTLMHKLNAGDRTGASAEFMNWIYVTDPNTKKLVVSEGLKNRRIAERELFDLDTPDAPAAVVAEVQPAPVPKPAPEKLIMAEPTQPPTPEPAPIALTDDQINAIAVAIQAIGKTSIGLKLIGWWAGYKTYFVTGGTSVSTIAGGIVAFANDKIDLHTFLMLLTGGLLALGQMALRHAVHTTAVAQVNATKVVSK